MNFSTPTLLALRLLEEPELEEGETIPLKIECGNIIDVLKNDMPNPSVYVVKFKSKVQNNGLGIISEVIAGHLANYFGIEIPQFAFIEITECFAQSVMDKYYPDYICTNINMNKHAHNFGSQLVDVTTSVPLLNENYSDENLVTAESVFAFDALINNADRTHESHNIFANKDSFIVFDHEKAFALLNQNSEKKENSFYFKKGNGESFLLNHIFYLGLKGKGCSFNEFIDKLDNLEDDILKEIVDQLPYNLRNPFEPEYCRIIDHIKFIRDHSKNFQLDLIRVLA